MALCSSLSLVPPIITPSKLTSKSFSSPTPHNFHGIFTKCNKNSTKFLLNAGFNLIEPDLNEDPVDQFRTNGIPPEEFEYGIFDGHHTFNEGEEKKGTFWGAIMDDVIAVGPPTGFQEMFATLVATSAISEYFVTTTALQPQLRQYRPHLTTNLCSIKACDLSWPLTTILSIIVDSNFDSHAGLISWLFPPAIAAGVFFDVPGEYLFIGAGIFTIVFCIIEMDKPDQPHHFEPQIYNMERGARDKLINDYNSMSIWDFNDKYGDLWDFTIKKNKDDIMKR